MTVSLLPLAASLLRVTGDPQPEVAALRAAADALGGTRALLIRITGAEPHGEIVARIGALPAPAPEAMQRVLASGMPTLDVDMEQPGAQSATIPLAVAGESYGVAIIAGVVSDAPLPLAALGGLLSDTLANVRQHRTLTMLRTTMLRLGTSLDLPDTLEAVLNGIFALVPCTLASIYLDGLAPDALVRVAARERENARLVPENVRRPLDGSVTGWVYRHRQSLLIADLRADPRTLTGPDAPPPDMASIVVPLLAGERAVGTFIASRRGRGSLTRHNLAVAEGFAPLAAQAVANARLFTETERAQIGAIRRRERDKALVAAVGHACNSAADGAAILRVVVEATAQWSDAAAIHTFAGERIELPAFAARDGKADATIAAILEENVRTQNLHRLNPYRIAHGGPAILPLVGREPTPLNDALLARGYHTLLFAPIRAAGEVVGLLTAGGGAGSPPFDAQSLATLELVAEQAGLAITKDRLLRRVEAQVAQLEEANRHKDDFLASLSHELRTPLNAILGFGQLIEDGVITDADELRDVARDIVISGQLLLDQVNGLLDMARVGSGQMEVARDAVNLCLVIATCERIVAPLVAAKRQRLSVEMPPDPPSVLGDGARVQQVILNLLTNAHKFTPEGGAISVTVRAGNDTVAIAVRDTGIGVAPEHAAAIFEPFRRVETGYARAQAGTGLGLALSRRLVELMGGTLTLDSAPGNGSTFTVTLPVTSYQTQ